MSKESLCLKVPKIYGEKTIILADELEINNRELEIQKDADFVYIPLLRRPRENELTSFTKQVSELQLLTRLFRERKKRAKTFVELLEGRLTPHELASLPRAVDIVGDIAIIEIPRELKRHGKIIGEAVLQLHTNVRTVLSKAGAVSGTYRTREFTVIAGEQRTVTVHREHGCKYYVDVAKVYFSPRLSYEHKRIASLVQEGETVVDLFAGVGPFAVLIARNHENVMVHAVDVNPFAVELLKKNLRLNRVENRVYPILGEAREIARNRLGGVADRVIMNLPEKAIEYVDAACKTLKTSDGIIHFYSFVKAEEKPETLQLRFTKAVENCGRKAEKILSVRTVRETAPHEWQVALDAKIH